MSKNITPTNENNRPHGFWVKYRYANDKIHFKCYFHNGKRVGYRECHVYSGRKLCTKEFYLR